MKILFTASEFAPLAKVGGLGDVVGSLPKALSRPGVDVSVAIPYYEEIRKKKIKVGPVLKNFPLYVGGNLERVNLYKARPPKNGASIYLVENKKYLGRGPVYFERTAFIGSFKEIQRFLFFSKALYELIAAGKLKPDIVHAHDWHSGALTSLIEKGKWKMENVRTVFTIHNLANQGVWSAKKVTKWFGDNPFRVRGGNFNFMAEGIENADTVTTVSPTYAREITAREHGVGLHNLLKKRARQRKLIGILNGIDYGFWPPKKRGKGTFQKSLGLKTRERAPIFGLVARLTYQKGIRLVAPSVGRFVKKHGAQFVFLGQGEAPNEKALIKLAKSHPREVFAKIGFDEGLAHKIYAQSDFFLMPSLFEPGGLGQMIAMRYGTVPIVRATGGLKDTVKNKKTGFTFTDPKPQSLARAMEEAIAAYRNPARFKKIIRNCKAQDFSWKKSAKKYLRLYRATF